MNKYIFVKLEKLGIRKKPRSLWKTEPLGVYQRKI